MLGSGNLQTFKLFRSRARTSEMGTSLESLASITITITNLDYDYELRARRTGTGTVASQPPGVSGLDAITITISITITNYEHEHPGLGRIPNPEPRTPITISNRRGTRASMTTLRPAPIAQDHGGLGSDVAARPDLRRDVLPVISSAMILPFCQVRPGVVDDQRIRTVTDGAHHGVHLEGDHPPRWGSASAGRGASGCSPSIMRWQTARRTQPLRRPRRMGSVRTRRPRLPLRRSRPPPGAWQLLRERR